MLNPGQAATIDREKALCLLAELQGLQHEHREVVRLWAMLGQMEGSGRGDPGKLYPVTVTPQLHSDVIDR